jgi:hypothetical protein
MMSVRETVMAGACSSACDDRHPLHICARRQAAKDACDIWEPIVEDQKATILSLCDVVDNLLNVISAQAAPDIVAHAVANAERVRGM